MSKYLKRIILFHLNLLKDVVDLMSINMKIPRIDSGCSLGKEFIKLISINS